MKTTLILILVLTLAGFLPGQNREFPGTSGNAFVRLCSVVEKDTAGTTTLESMQVMACLGYIDGLKDGVVSEIAFAKVNGDKSVPQPYCRPDGVENGQLVSIVLKYIKGHPESAHVETAALAILAFREAFPCGDR